MTDLITIKGRLRKEGEQGKNVCRRLRTQGQIPANILHKAKSELIVLDTKLLSTAWKSGKTFNLEIDGAVKPVVIKELQIDPVKRHPLHVDLMYT